jgi:hypothetical protein
MKKQTTPAKPAKTTGRSKATKPIKNKEDIQRSNDEHIDQDFPGYPHPPSEGSIIRNGSAGAFEATENTLDEYDSDEDNDDSERDKSHY